MECRGRWAAVEKAGQGEIGRGMRAQRLFPGPAGLGRTLKAGQTSFRYLAPPILQYPRMLLLPRTPHCLLAESPESSSGRPRHPVLRSQSPVAPIAAGTYEAELPRVPMSLSPTFLVALGFGHRSVATCGGSRCCLLGPQRRGGLWDGPRKLSWQVPDPISCAALLPPPGTHQRSSPRLQGYFSHVGGAPNPKHPIDSFTCGPNSMVLWRRHLRRGACRVGGGWGPGSHHGGCSGFPILSLGCPAYPCGCGL